MINTGALIETLVGEIGNILPCYYDRAKKDAQFPYCVLTGINPSDLAAGDLVMFDLEVWGNDRLPRAAEKLEEHCDSLRNDLQGALIRNEGAFAGHIGFEGRDTSEDRVTDLLHRRLFFSARIFYF